jgi:hypothetical protein
VAVNAAEMVCVPVPRLLEVTVTWHVDTPGVAVEASVQGLVIVSPESEVTATVPLGNSFPPADSVSVTVMVAVEAWFTATVDGLRLTVVVVARVLTVWLAVVEALLASEPVALKLPSPL